MKNFTIFFFLFFVICGLQTQAQRSHLDDGNDYFARRLYKEAIAEYNQALKERVVINKDLMLTRIADTYFMLFEYENAENSYRRVFSECSEVGKESYLNMSRVLLNNMKYDEAKTYIEKYRQKGGDNIQAEIIENQIKFAKENENNIANIKVTVTNIETGSRSMGVAFYKQGLLLANPQIKDFVNNTAFYDMAYAVASTPVQFGNISSLEGEMHHDYYEGAPSVSTDGNVLYYTGNSSEITKFRKKKLEKNKYAISKTGENILKIYSATHKEGKWININELKINSNEYNCTFPCISDEGNTLYFVSDMPGGFGGYDIYSVEKSGDNWGKPFNLGNRVNSAADEMYPYIFNNKLYFSSKGHPGFGGADIYIAIKDGGTYGRIENAGKPLNSSKDDFAFVIKTENNKEMGYLSSNREGVNGYDRIYYFEQELPQYQKFVVTDSPENLVNFVVNSLTDAPESTGANISMDSIFSLPKNVDNNRYSFSIKNLEDKSAKSTCIAMLDDNNTIVGYARYVKNNVFEADIQNPQPECKAYETSSAVITEVKVDIKPVTYQKMHGYNEISVTDNEKLFLEFINGVEEIIRVKGSVTVAIESSASEVPTKKFGNNQTLAERRGVELKQRIENTLKGKNISKEKLVFEKINAIVQGPTYDKDQQNTSKYAPYQYIKAVAK